MINKNSELLRQLAVFRVSKKLPNVKKQYNPMDFEITLPLWGRWHSAAVTDEVLQKLAKQGLLTYCTTRSLPYHLYADGSELFVLTALVTSASLSKNLFFDRLTKTAGLIARSFGFPAESKMNLSNGFLLSGRRIL